MLRPHQCHCSSCREDEGNPTSALHALLNYVLTTLDDRQQRLLIGLEVKRRGPGSERAVALITGWDEQSIAVACRELEHAVSPKRDRAAEAQAALEAKLRMPPLPPFKHRSGHVPWKGAQGMFDKKT